MLMHFLEHKELADVYYSRDGAHYEQVRVESTDQMPRFDGLFVRWYQAVYNFSKHQSCEELQQWTQKPLTFRIWIILQTRK
jgi:hypothetical protein